MDAGLNSVQWRRLRRLIDEEHARALVKERLGQDLLNRIDYGPAICSAICPANSVANNRFCASHSRA